jgi:penicillin-binding protein 1B
VYAEPEALPEEEQGGGWRSWFGLDRKAPQDPAKAPPEQSAPPPPQQEQR